MQIDLLKITFPLAKVNDRDIPKIRGFIASKFPQYLDLHNHTESGGFNYSYPMVQYKNIENEPTVLAINQSVKTLIEVIYDLKEIDIKNAILSTSEKGFIVSKNEFGESDDILNYEFLTPWIGLNQQNHKNYLEFDEQKQNEMLKKILIGNLLSISKSFGYTVKKELKVFLKLSPINVNFKNKEMIGFKGEFLTNFIIPDYLGIGKSVSRGFGTVRKVKKGGFI